MEVLEWYDEVRSDPQYMKKQESLEQNSSRSWGVPYTTMTVKSGWATPEQRARITRACSKDYAQSLLRIDKTPGARKQGKYP